MEASRFKNMVIIKNLPSNIVEEAIIVLKANKKIKNLQNIEPNKKIVGNENTIQDKDFILKEAEMLLNSYVSKFENKKNNYINNKSSDLKKLKKYSIYITIFSILELLIIIL